MCSVNFCMEKQKLAKLKNILPTPLDKGPESFYNGGAMKSGQAVTGTGLAYYSIICYPVKVGQKGQRRRYGAK